MALIFYVLQLRENAHDPPVMGRLKHMNRRQTLMAALAAAMLPLGWAPARAEDAVTVIIGKLLELTGPLSETGPSQDKAVTIAIDYANQAAAAAGVPVKASAVSADAQGDPQAALSAARALVAKGASAIIGPSITPESIAVANGLTIQKRISVWPTGTSMRLRTIKDEGTIFRTVPPDSLQAYALAGAVADKLGDPKGKLLSIAYRNEPYGEGLARDLKAAWTAKGGRVQGPVVFDPAQATFDSEAEQVVDNNPDAYVVIDYPDTFAKFGASLVRTGKYDATKLFVPDALALSTVPGHAGPCAQDVDRAWMAVDANIRARIAAGRSAPQGTIALLLHQPTPSSIAAAEEALSERWSPIEAAVTALARAREADLAGDRNTCEQALLQTQRTIEPAASTSLP